MAYPAYITEKAQQLRRQQKMTIDEIAECLALQKRLKASGSWSA